MNLISEKYTKQLEALGSQERIKILELLSDREMCVQELNKYIFSSQATLSYHLMLLKDCGFIKARKDGKFVFYSLAMQNIKAYLKGFVKDFSLTLSVR